MQYRVSINGAATNILDYHSRQIAVRQPHRRLLGSKKRAAAGYFEYVLESKHLIWWALI
jgi:hypothetical protein